ncbi:glycosyltransferase family 2 protein [uncultured Amnibacterium sp.]|uniref:glycosyltransferase family 2 protein n=1 Tax=uncultured Amnibacterium sp. TaxID=1631851 RepID=UPI0035C958EC
MPSSAPTVSIVVPARNEARNLEVVLPLLPAVHQVVLVDGHSVDDTIETAKRVMPGIHVVQQTRRGKGNALACGFAAATGDIIVMFDADGSADPDEIPAFVRALTEGADVAKGSRFTRGGGSEDITRFRSLGNLFLNTVTNLLLGSRYTDLCYGYNAFWRRLVPGLHLPDHTFEAADTMIWGDGFEIETVLNCRFFLGGHRIVEVGSVEKSRIFGESNLNAIRDGFRVLRTILSERRHARRTARLAVVEGAVRGTQRRSETARKAA